ncbi:MAG: hypothetical protein AAB579_00835 [Patescibacteria group bacterium]
MITTVSEITALVRTDVRSALALLQKPPSETGLTLKGAADVLDEVVGQFTDPREARGAMEQHLTVERRVELLAGRGDLPSSAAIVADADDVFAAMLADLEDDAGEEMNAHLLRAWMQEKLMDRDDYADFLNREIGGRSICDHLLALVYYEAEHVMRTNSAKGECPSARQVIDSITADTFDNLGMDPDEGRSALRWIVKRGMPKELTVEEAARAGKRLAERRRKVREAPTTVVVAQDAASETAKKIEF